MCILIGHKQSAYRTGIRMSASLGDHYSGPHRHYSQHLRVAYITKVLFHMQIGKMKASSEFYGQPTSKLPQQCPQYQGQPSAQPCQSLYLCHAVGLNGLASISNVLLLCYTRKVARTCQPSWPELVVIESNLNYTSMKQSPGGKLQRC